MSPEERVRKDHPLRPIRAMVDEVLQQLSRRLDAMYAKVGRPSIPPEQLLRAQLALCELQLDPWAACRREDLLGLLASLNQLIGKLDAAVERAAEENSQPGC